MFPIFDLHSHPCLKIYLFDKNINDSHNPIPDLNPFGMHVDLPGLKEAQVQVAAAFHYVPEAGFGQLPKSKKLFDFLKISKVKLIQKFEPNDTPEAFNKALQSITLLNNQVREGENRFNAVIPKNLAAFEEGFAAGKIMLLHCIEGAHHLGKNYIDDNQYLENLKQLKERGLCIFTLSHFFQNAICDSAGGIPPSLAKKLGYGKPHSTSQGLTDIGKLTVEWCQENGVILDLVHATPETRNQVYDILERRLAENKAIRPPIFSHSGIREKVSNLNAALNMTNVNINDQMILPNIEELITIKKYGGVLGLILMNYWLNGKEEDDILKHEKGIEVVLDTIAFIKKEIGDYDNIAIGTDLDGFTQVPDDVPHVRKMGKLRDALVDRFGEEAAKKICFENALRVIRAGWS